MVGRVVTKVASMSIMGTLPIIVLISVCYSALWRKRELILLFEVDNFFLFFLSERRQPILRSITNLNLNIVFV